MPELPEVETTAAELRPQILEQHIAGVHVLWPRTIATPDRVEFAARLPGQRIERVGRRGKYLLIELDSGDTLIVHLRMTGKLRVEPPGDILPDEVHVRVWFDLADGRRLVFTDARKFGRMWLVEDQAAVVGKLGPEPLDWTFTPEVLGQRIHGRRVSIKSLLLDQGVVAGVGNIYADESLFVAGIHPRRPASSLDEAEITRLHWAIRKVLAESVEQRGTTLRDYRPPYGETGGYQEQLRVYGKNKAEPCPICGTPVVRIVIGQRSAHFCPHCQPAGDHE